MDRVAVHGEHGVSDALPADIRMLFQKRLGRFGAGDVAISPELDQDGDPILLVEVKHKLVDHAVPLKDVLAVDRDARDLAQKTGELRFLHVRHIFDDKQQLADAS